MAFPNAGEPLLPGQEKALSTVKTNFLGAIAYTPDGRRFRYARSGGTSLGGGQVVQSRVIPTTDHSGGLAFATARTSGNTLASGVSTVPLVCATTPVSSANMYVDGYVQVEVGPDSGLYMIKKHAASTAAGATVVFELYGDDKIRTAWTTATRVGLRLNPYADVVITPAGGALTAFPLGVVPTDVPANTYFWLQDEGVGSINGDTSAALPGAPMGFATGTTAGHVKVWTTNEAANYQDKAIVARAAQGLTTPDVAMFVNLTF